jgi:hypothetical protein
MISPDNLQTLSFQQVGILDTDTFKQLLVQKFLPTGLGPQSTNEVLQLGMNPSVQIGLVVNALEGILLNP